MKASHIIFDMDASLKKRIFTQVYIAY